jgi:hypothetical protein
MRLFCPRFILRHFIFLWPLPPFLRPSKPRRQETLPRPCPRFLETSAPPPRLAGVSPSVWTDPIPLPLANIVAQVPLAWERLCCSILPAGDISLQISEGRPPTALGALDSGKV